MTTPPNTFSNKQISSSLAYQLRRQSSALLALAAFFSLSACSSGPTTGAGSQGTSSYSQKVAKYASAAQSGDAGEITFYRQKRIYGSALDMSIHIDNIHVADLNPGDYVKVKAAPGRHTVYSDDDSDEIVVNVMPRSQNYFRVFLNRKATWGGKGKLEAVDSGIGAQQVVTWKVKPTTDIEQPALVKP